MVPVSPSGTASKMRIPSFQERLPSSFFSTWPSPKRIGHPVVVLHGSYRFSGPPSYSKEMKEPVNNCPIYDLAGIVDTQKRFFASGKSQNLPHRLERLAKLEHEIIRQADALLAALASDLGKPALEAYVAEYHFVLTEIRLFRKNLVRWARPQRVGNPFFILPARSEIRRDPFGVALIAAPWNYPFQLSLSPLVAAVAAGNCVVLKPSELAPATSRLLSGIVAAVFDPAHVTVVEGGPETGEALLGLPFDFWFYTGSERVGRLYAEAAARTLTPIALELGGKCPCLVDTDVDLKLTVERVLSGKFFNAGQTCIAPDFVLVPESLKADFLAAAREILTTSYGDDNPGDLACMISDSHYRRLESLSDPNEIRIGEDDPGSRRLAPRLIPDADWDSPSMREEIFGPVLPVIGYTCLEEAIARLARLPSPLALYVFSRNREVREHIATSIRSGSICFNDTLKQATNLGLPFGGVGPSGMGRYRGRAGFDCFTYARSVTRRFFLRDLFATRPPYGNQLEQLRKILR
jgi:aldehyde dehydrogenase (NAD+)